MRMALLVLVLVAAACGTERAEDIDSATTTTIVVDDAAAPGAAPADDRPETGSQQASRDPQPVTEPVLTPVPAPAPEPTKPVRPALPTPPPSRSAPVDPEPIAPSADEIRDAIADLAARIGAEAIDVLDARPVTWPDGSIGCPEPGLAYTQAEVPGSLIVLRAGESSYRYHAADGGPFFYCENPQAPLEGGA